MAHHTKDKGDVGLGFVIADLLKNGIQVALPMSEHLPFDLIAISSTLELRKVSVKYRDGSSGRVELSKRSTWADRHGSHVRSHAAGDYDVIAAYCPTNGRCYYVKPDEFGKRLSLRLDAEAFNVARRMF